MFGIYRYVLANLVVLGHLFPAFIGDTRGPQYAVFGFYALSGFLMTCILHESYGFSFTGVKAYVLNRLLRIFPLYWAVIIIALVIIALFPDPGYPVKKCLSMPGSLIAWLQNIFIFGLGSTLGTKPALVRLVPPAWSLHVELLFFFAIPLLVKTKTRVVVWVLASILVLAFTALSHHAYPYRYVPVQAASLPYSLGALAYFVSRKIDVNNVKVIFSVLIIFVGAFFLNLIFGPDFTDPRGIPFYINLFLNIGIILLLFKIPRRIFPPKFFLADKFMGDLAFPIFLLHGPIAALISVLVFNRKNLGGFWEQAAQFCLVLLVINAMAIMLCVLIEKRVERIRKRIRPKTECLEKALQP